MGKDPEILTPLLPPSIENQMQMNGQAQSLVFKGDFNRIASVPFKYEKDVQNSILKDELRTRRHQLQQKVIKGRKD